MSGKNDETETVKVDGKDKEAPTETKKEKAARLKREKKEEADRLEKERVAEEKARQRKADRIVVMVNAGDIMPDAELKDLTNRHFLHGFNLNTHQNQLVGILGAPAEHERRTMLLKQHREEEAKEKEGLRATSEKIIAWAEKHGLEIS